ncbi:hypothetical protein Tco_0782121 [Tanacetum coccineum]
MTGVQILKLRITGANRLHGANTLMDFGGVTGLITFTDGIKEVTFKTPYKDPGMEDLVSEGHDLLSSRVILSEDDYWRGCKKASDLENEFYTYVDNLDPLYKGEIDRIYLDEVCEVSNEGGVTFDSESSYKTH